jgi:hypothetical protein
MQERLPRSSVHGRRFYCLRRLAVPVVVHSALDLGDRVICELQRGFTMSAFVAVGVFQFRTGQFQMTERRLHARLIGAGTSGDESRSDGGDDEQGDDETMKFHGFSSYLLIDAECAEIAYGFSH